MTRVREKSPTRLFLTKVVHAAYSVSRSAKKLIEWYIYETRLKPNPKIDCLDILVV